MSDPAANGRGAARAVALLGRLNRGVAIVLGMALLVTVALILTEVMLRGIAGGLLGGTDEVSGYVMAAVAAWGFAFALTERAHVRIDLLHRRLPGPGRIALDLVSLASLAVVAGLVSYHGWRVLGVTVERGSRANTALETPLWIPQAVWVLGWTWFAACALSLLVCAAILVTRGDGVRAETAIGLVDDAEAAS